MTNYRDVTADPYTPRTKIDWTAKAILDELNGHPPGTAVLIDDIDTAISTMPGASLTWKPWAVKALKNLGFPLTVHPRRHLTVYVLGGTADQHEDHRQHAVRDGYSRTVSLCRCLAGAILASPMDPALSVSMRTAQMTAMALGTDPAVGKTVADVLSDLAPLP